MPIPLSLFARPFLINRQLRGTLDCPVVLLELEAPLSREDALATNPGGASSRPTLAEPLVFEVKKAGKATNAFALGITIGRTDNNDICLEDESVSRFHGYFQRDASTDLWSLVDTGSLNGTSAGGTRLVANKPHVCAAREKLVIGKIGLLFLVPETFFSYVDDKLQPVESKSPFP